jgi:hypothetical protein
MSRIISTFVAGVTHSDRQSLIATLANEYDWHLTLRSEPTNVFDPNAVQVVIVELQESIGYLPKDIARDLASALSNVTIKSFMCEPFGSNGKQLMGVKLELDVPDDAIKPQFEDSVAITYLLGQARELVTNAQKLVELNRDWKSVATYKSGLDRAYGIIYALNHVSMGIANRLRLNDLRGAIIAEWKRNITARKDYEDVYDHDDDEMYGSIYDVIDQG